MLLRGAGYVWGVTGSSVSCVRVICLFSKSILLIVCVFECL